ncbi:GPI ethanolamine phosphate transferase 2-like [Elysia marginata]|uniref:GPI ethanolamine phosphate transferase 2-like n=1 Tax=Elysia marginata TaxID=1093978 RepID=A0AAV4F4Z6_9GAST|nr:GPI ethanolamine phosphate transferase 2-like [Elysia marginata]
MKKFSVFQVDDNVTRHLHAELANPTWDMMILHYLGLDHIGHFAGPRSPLIGPKLAEMDRIINQIYHAMEKWTEQSLLIVCGDHGMSDQGGHGGASPGEISVPVLFLSPHILNSDPKHFGTISQTDLCPTLAVLQGVPIPSGNIGKVVTEALMGYSLEDKVTILHHNAMQAMNILKECVSDLHKESAYILFQETEVKLRQWFTSKNGSAQSAWERQGLSLITSLGESLTLISEKVSKLATSYDVYAMAISIVLMWMMLVSLVLSSLQERDERLTTPATLAKRFGPMVFPVLGSAILSHIIMCTGGVPSDTVCSASVSGVLVQAALMVIFVSLAGYITAFWPRSLSTLRKQVKVMMARCSQVETLLLVGTVSHTFTLLSSSFVEEEHQTYYFLATAVHFLFLIQLSVRYIQGFRRTSPQQQNPVCNFDTIRNKQVGGGPLFSTCNHRRVWDHKGEVIEAGEETQAEQQRFYTKIVNTACSDDETLVKNLSFSDSSATPTHSTFKQHKGDNLTEDISVMQHCLPKGSDGRGTVQPYMTTTSFLHWAFSVVAVLLMLRILRRWNHTGNKWLDIPDFGDWLVKPENKTYLSLLTVFAFMIIGASRGSRLKRVQTMCVNLALCCAYLCRVAEGSLIFPYRKFISSSGVFEARASYFFIILTCLISLLPEDFLRLENKASSPQPRQTSSQSRQPSPKSASIASKTVGSPSTALKQKSIPPSTSSSSNKVQKSNCSGSTVETKKSDSQPNLEVGNDDSFSLQQRLGGIMAATVCFACLVKQPHNAPVAAAMSLAEQMMTPVLIQTGCRPTYSLLYCMWMGQVFFFLKGNSNSLSTVDIAAGYVGLDSYWPLMNGLLLFLATYVGAIFWALAFLNFLISTQEQPHNPGQFISVPDVSCKALLLTRVLPLSMYMALVAAQRYHLFVWSVFSPKMLYEAASTVVVGLQLFMFICVSGLRLK